MCWWRAAHADTVAPPCTTTQRAHTAVAGKPVPAVGERAVLSAHSVLLGHRPAGTSA